MIDHACLLKVPNLPKNAVKQYMVGEGKTETEYELSELGLSPIRLIKNALLDEETSTHADMLCLYCGENKFILSAEQQQMGEYLKTIGADVLYTNEPVHSPYPCDVALNAAFIGSKLLANIKALTDRIYDFAGISESDIINTKQGYSKCSVCVVAKDAVITEDSGIAYLLKKYQCDVCEIKPGNVRLSEKHSGFLGGASGKIAPDKMYFNGDITMHSDYKEISAFLTKYNVEPFYNKKRVLTDIGGIIPITELNTDNS